MKFKLAGEVAHSFVNGPGIRYVVFFQGCTHACSGCHNPETHDIDAGEMADTTEVISRIGSVKYLDGITLSGGDPLLQPEACAEIARAAKDMGLSVWAYSGWTFDQLVQDEKCREALRYIDTLVDGPFIESRMIQDSEKCLWRGSDNQRLIAAQASLRAMRGIELKDLMQN